MHQTECDFTIKKENHAAVLEAIKGIPAGHYSWVNQGDKVLRARHIEQAFEEWRWIVEFSIDDDINDIQFQGEKYGDEDNFFKTIAPWVEAGSYIAMQGEDGDMWRWYFDGKTCVTQKPEITWPTID
jgi:hypothetical protein